MLKVKLQAILVFFMCININAQNFNTRTIIERRAYYLNGGTRATLGGKSRTVIKIDLPKNTKQCYYSFSTTPGEDGTKLLNLGLQLSASLYSGGLSALASKAIAVPPGSGAADIIVLPTNQVDIFLNKGEYRYYRDISVENAKQAVQPIANKYGDSFYLGLRNPSAISGINIVIEVVAVVEEVNPEADKGVLYGNLGWKEFENGNYDKCVELSNKALTYNPNLIYVVFNIALVHLLQGKESSTEDYINSISEVKKDKNPKNTLLGALQDVRALKMNNPNLKNISTIEEMLMNELANY